MIITRIRAYRPRPHNPNINQSDLAVTIETDTGLVGIGEGGTPDLLAQAAAMLIGEDPARIQHLWQMLYRGYFYPAGREKLHALGALDLALWDLKGKALGVPVYELLGGRTRDFVECYSTSYPWQGSLGATAQACLSAGFRAFRTATADPDGPIFNARRMVDQTAAHCREIRAALGPDGEWCVDFHTRLDMPDAVRLAGLLEELNPLFIEDPLRSENPGALAEFRAQTGLPVAVGEQFGDKWDLNELVERRLIDHARVTLPNVGGITEWVKIMALCETHYVGLVPHFTGPISLAALTQVLAAWPGPALMEIAGAAPRQPAHLPRGVDFHDGKLWPASLPGLGVEFDPAGADLVGEITERSAPIPQLRRPDGSYTNW
ncbi:MAG: mandelate racemase/muconate lactonizing enzyme family protein [Anaerolineales bacterium]